MNSKEEGSDISKNHEEECFKWEVLAALHHEEIEHHLERTCLLQYYEDQCNWMGLIFHW